MMQIYRSKRMLFAFVAMALMPACASRQCPPQATVSPRMPSLEAFNIDVDLEVAQIFNDPPITGRLPRQPSWSPDSTHIAFLRSSENREGKPQSELWVHELAGHRERPILAKDELPVGGYSWCGDKTLLIGVKGDLYLVDLTGKVERLTETESSEEGAQCSLKGDKIAFVRDHNLFVYELERGSERQLTEGGTEDKSFGEVTWIYGEEFRTEDGFKWSPDGESIWFFQMDVTEVVKRTIVADAEGTAYQQPYPRPGETNPLVRVGVLDLRDAKPELKWLKLGKDPDNYIPQVVWHPDSHQLIAVRLDRLQTRIDLNLCDTASGSCRVVLSEQDPRWVNLLGKPEFLKDGKEFLWLSERDGFSHIFRFGLDGSARGQVTQGNWVVANINAVDEESNSVYFTANVEKTTNYDVYKISLSSGEPQKVSQKTGTHYVTFAPDAAHFLDTHSALARPPRTEVCAADGQVVATLDAADLREYARNDVARDLFPIKSRDGHTLMAMLTRPAVVDQKHKYPVLVYVYGGPHAQIARDGFRSTYQPWFNLLASRGILVFSVDGHGSAGRGREFEAAVHRRLGEMELLDQEDGVAYLKTLPFVDPKRIGIFGWSYGGTMVLNALLRTKDIFRLGVAVAPVTDWRTYDSAYTERYMQRPADNPEGYQDTSLIERASELDVPLLLVHGLADDNVHFVNTSRLLDAFVEAGKMLDVMFYPGQKHGIRKTENRTHLFTKITRFLERHL